MVERSVDRIRPGVKSGSDPLRSPVMVWRASEPGACVAITANVHGDELTGISVIHELERWLPSHLCCGTVLLYPSVNPVGLAAFSRGVGAQGGDLNRVFPGGGRGVADRLAGALWEDLHQRRPDALIDIHADSTDSIPYAILDRPILVPADVRSLFEAEIAAIGQAMGVTVLQDYGDADYRRFGLDRSLTGAAVNQWRIPAVTLEVGPRRAVDPSAVKAAVGVVQNVLVHLGLAQGPKLIHPSRLSGGPWTRSTAIRASTEGFFRNYLPAGATFRNQEAIGEMVSLSGELVETILSPTEGIVVSWSDRRWLTPGSSVGTFGFVESTLEQTGSTA